MRIIRKAAESRLFGLEQSVLLVLLAMISFSSQATVIQLSEFMGVSSGETTNESNAPYTDIIVPAESGGFGVDITGRFSTSPIQFSDTGPFERGIGAHPNSHIDFNLDAFRALGSFDIFMTTVGIDIAGLSDPGHQGLTFEVLGDGALLASVEVPNISAGSTTISVNVDSFATLSLITRYAPFDPQTNWGAWADAKLISVPEPGTLGLLGLGLAGMGLARRRKKI